MAQSDNILEKLEGGKICLYLRENSKGSAIHYRIRVAGARGYERKSTGETDLAAAREVARDRYFELRREVKKGNRVALPKTVKSVSTSYLAYLRRRVDTGIDKKSKLETSTQILNTNIVPFFGDKPIDKIRAADLQAYQDTRAAQTIKTGRKDEIGKKKVSRNTIATELAYLASLMSYAINVLDIMRNDDRPKTGWGGGGRIVDNRRPAFSHEQIETLLEKMPEWVNQAKGINHVRLGENLFFRQRMSALVEFLLFTGSRIGEARNLQWRHVAEKNGSTQLIVTGKTGERSYPAPKDAAHSLEEWRAFTEEHFGKPPAGDDYVFQNPQGQQLAGYGPLFQNLLQHVRLTMDESTLKSFSIYGLRHSFASEQKLAGADVSVTAAMMGHSRETHERTYIHIPTPTIIEELNKSGARRKGPRARDTLSKMIAEPDPDAIDQLLDEHAKKKR